MRYKQCPNCRDTVTWDTSHSPNAWRHRHDSRWCMAVGDAEPVYPKGAGKP